MNPQMSVPERPQGSPPISWTEQEAKAQRGAGLACGQLPYRDPTPASQPSTVLTAEIVRGCLGLSPEGGTCSYVLYSAKHLIAGSL